LLSQTAHWHGCGFVRSKHNSSTFLRPLAPPALPGFFATMGALTPVRPAYHRPIAGQVSLVHMVRPSLHSVTNHLTHSVIALFMPSQRDGLPGVRTLSPPRSELRTLLAGSPRRPAESCSSSYGLQVRLRLLSTLPHGNAVTFNYRERTSPGRGLSPLRSHLLPGARAQAPPPVCLPMPPKNERETCAQQPRHKRDTSAPKAKDQREKSEKLPRKKREN
jgi:hypothetical protein